MTTYIFSGQICDDQGEPLPEEVLEAFVDKIMCGSFKVEGVAACLRDGLCTIDFWTDDA